MHPSVGHYLATLAAQRRSPHTLRAVRLDLDRFIAWWEASPGEWPPLGQAASAQAGSGPDTAGTAPTGCPRLAHCWASQSRQS